MSSSAHSTSHVARSRSLADHLRFYAELGVTGISRDPAWRQRGSADPAAAVDEESPEPASGPSETDMPKSPDHDVEPAPVIVPLARSASEALSVIREDLGDCTRCKLHGLGRRQIVFGVGNPTADVMFVGEAPGADEDVQGEPFVGRAGQLLTKMIEAMGFRRQEVYIANVLKCRPPGNRNPEPDEVEQCEPFLLRQIASVQPKVIIALGAFAIRTVLKSNAPVSRLRGRVHEVQGVKVVPTFHPSFLLRSPGYKREAWEDLKLALTLLDREPPPSTKRSSQ